ncbi:MAG: hypothetical protein ACREP5_15305, partial [Candidatus Binatia bacterium]
MKTLLFAKRVVLIPTTVVILTAVLLLSARGGSEAVDLILSHGFPARHVQQRLLLEPFKKELED